jgi:DNA processing protein
MSVDGLGPVTFTALLGAFGTASRVLATASETNGQARLLESMADWTTPSDDGARRSMLGPDLARRISDRAADPDAALHPIGRLGLEYLTLDDPDYPWRLRSIEQPPPLLFLRGSAAALSTGHAAAVVGTRRPTDRGRLLAGWIASGLARGGAVVVSGLAVGIDGAAHAAVVAEGLATVAVLGGGHARLFPRSHERLADAIVAAGGAVVSELGPGTPPSQGTFPRRNRLVSGLSDATIVVEAGRRSGALITAGWALEQGRECLLVPGPLDSPASEGCNFFLRCFPGQARVVCGIPELLEDLGLGETAPALESAAASASGGRRKTPSPVAPSAGREAVLAGLGPVERELAEALSRGPATADDLARGTCLAGATILSALTLLELRGLVTSAYGRYAPAGSLICWPGKTAGRRSECPAKPRSRGPDGHERTERP